MTEQVSPTPHIKFVPAWLTKLFGSVVVLFAILLVALVAGGTWGGYQILKRQDRSDRQLEIVTTNLQVLHEQVIIRDIIEEKLPKLSPDVKAKFAFEIWDGSRRLGCQSWLILAVIEKESCWKQEVVSSAGACGLLQLMPGTALTAAQAEGIVITDIKQVFEPVTNLRLGLRVLQNNYRGAVMSGKSPEGDFTKALYHYNGGGEAYARLVMEKASVYQKRLQSPIQGKIKAPEATPDRS